MAIRQLGVAATAAADTPTKSAVDAGISADGFYPGDQGYLAWAFPPILGAGSTVAAGGIPQVSRVPVPKLAPGVQFSNIDFWVSAAGVTLTAGANWIAVYSSAGVKLAAFAADTAFATASKGTANFTAINLADTAGFLYIWLVSAGGTTVALTRSATTPASGLMNINLAATALRVSTAATAVTPPATIGTLTAATGQLWFGLRT